MAKKQPNPDKQFNDEMMAYLKNITYWVRQMRVNLKEKNKEYKCKLLRNGTDAIYSKSVRMCDKVTDYIK